MTTSGIGNLLQNYGTNKPVAKSTKEPMDKMENMEGKMPPPPPKNQDTYVRSAEANEALASAEGAASITETDVTETASSVDLSTLEETGTFETDVPTTFKLDKEAVAQLKADYAEQQKSFYDSMVSMITKQAGTFQSASGIWDVINLGDYEVTEEMQAEAKEAISEDGYWGVEQTANRIVDMAKALAGGDPSKAEEMMSYIEKGFASAEKAWGSELPSITGDTKNRIDELFAEWTGVSNEGVVIE